MLIKLALLSSSLTTAAAFAPTAQHSSSSSTTLRATIEETAQEALVREAPGAGWVPDWEDRPGLPESEFLASDMAKPDLAGMWECPLTKWDSEG